MDETTFRATLATRYGDATFTFAVHADGRLSTEQVPLAGLPDTVYQLTYGHDWPTVKTYFADLSALIPWWVQAYSGVADVPGFLRPVVHAIPGLKSTEELTQITAFRKYRPNWQDLFHPDRERRNGALSRLTAPGQETYRREVASHLEAYLRALIQAPTLGSVAEAYRLLGALGTTGGRRFLLDELARDGRHPYASHILAGLRFHQDGEVVERVRTTYRQGHFAEDDLPAVLSLLRDFREPRTVPFVRELLRDHAYLVESAITVLRSVGLQKGEIVDLLVEHFQAEETYHHLDILLRATNRQAPGTIDLAAMNERAADSSFLDVPPVNWPQQLESGWSSLVRETPMTTALAIITDYLNRSAPRLQRNALLQLKQLTDRDDFDGQLPAAVEERLAELLTSPFDKVYVEVLNLLGKRHLHWRNSRSLLDAILRRSLRTRYRIVLLKALRRVGDSEEARRHAREFFRDAVQQSTSAVDLEHLGALLPYLEKYFGEATALRTQLAERAASYTD